MTKLYLRTFDKGVQLCIGEKYSGNENWYLCSTPRQKDDWVPGQVISWISETSGIAKETYTAKELDVNSGDVLLGTKELNGWIWCMSLSNSEEGWVPLRNLRKMENDEFTVQSVSNFKPASHVVE